MAPGPARLIHSGRPGYPAGLTDLGDAPERIHVLGVLPAGPAIAIVGARAATPYGLGFAAALAGDLARLGFAVVSGLARGIDAAAHCGALDAGGTTVAVLPAGLDAVTPPSNRLLAERIAKTGAWVAEWPVGTAVRPQLFLRRNRMIAALAVATVVVEAGVTSGALSTAAAARRLARPVLAVPGDVDRAGSRGCHMLLRSGALLCEGTKDVLAAIASPAPTHAEAGHASQPGSAGRDQVLVGVSGRGAGGRAPGRATNPAAVASTGISGGPESRGLAVLAALGRTPVAAEGIAAAAGLAVADTLAELLALEWAGLAVAHPGGRWSERA